MRVFAVHEIHRACIAIYIEAWSDFAELVASVTAEERQCRGADSWRDPGVVGDPGG